jgi:hypothetical protein
MPNIDYPSKYSRDNILLFFGGITPNKLVQVVLWDESFGPFIEIITFFKKGFLWFFVNKLI